MKTSFSMQIPYWGCLLLLLAGGCDRFQSQPAPPPPPPPPAPAPVAVVTPEPVMPAPPPPPPMKSSDEIIKEFLAVPPSSRTNVQLVELSKLGDGLNEIRELDLRQSQITEEGLAVLGSFPRLRYLNLSSCELTNPVLKALEGCRDLETLILAETPLDNSGLVHLVGLSRLRELDLTGTQITEAGFITLKSLPALESLKLNRNQNVQGYEFDRIVDGGGFLGLKLLSVNDTAFAPQAVQSLPKLKKLEVFEGNRTGINDLSMTPIGRCTQLRILHLNGTAVTALGMKKLAKLDVLEELGLRDCSGIADVAFNFLKANKSLRVLDVNNTSCSPAAVQLLSTRFLMDTDILYNNTTY